jgi:hypothetical protein
VLFESSTVQTHSKRDSPSHSAVKALHAAVNSAQKMPKSFNLSTSEVSLHSMIITLHTKLYRFTADSFNCLIQTGSIRAGRKHEQLKNRTFHIVCVERYTLLTSSSKIHDRLQHEIRITRTVIHILTRNGDFTQQGLTYTAPRRIVELLANLQRL